MYHCTAHIDGYDFYLKLQSDIEHFQHKYPTKHHFVQTYIQKACYYIEYTQSCTNIILAPVMSINSHQVRKNRSLVGF